jgi:hypothetical protein
MAAILRMMVIFERDWLFSASSKVPCSMSFSLCAVAMGREPKIQKLKLMRLETNQPALKRKSQWPAIVWQATGLQGWKSR